jgi:hypothetical protein
MTMIVKEQKKVVVLGWQTEGDNPWNIKGNHATLSSMNPATDETFEEDKTVDNDGTGDLSFPTNYTGTCKAKVRGSDAGEDELEFPVL